MTTVLVPILLFISHIFSRYLFITISSYIVSCIPYLPCTVRYVKYYSPLFLILLHFSHLYASRIVKQHLIWILSYFHHVWLMCCIPLQWLPSFWFISFRLNLFDSELIFLLFLRNHNKLFSISRKTKIW